MSQLRQRTVLLTLAGSRAHGTATAESDLDVIGVAVPSRVQALGVFQAFEQENRPDELAVFVDLLPPDEQKIAATSKLEGTVYELRKLVGLAAGANPNILELLFCRDQEVRVSTAIGDQLREGRDLFISAKCRHTFGGYAASQLNRIRLHHRWHHDGPVGPPERAEFGLPEMTTLPKSQIDAAEAAVRTQLDRWELDLSEVDAATRIDIETRVAKTLSEWGLAGDEARWGAAARWVGLEDNLIHVMQQERRWRAARGEWQRYRRWLKNRNPHRAALEAAHGYDTKHGAHLVRLLRMGLEIVTTGAVNVWRGDIDADELLHIRNGGWSYEELLDRTASARDSLESAESVVRARPNAAKIDELCVRLTEAGFKLGSA
jgi:predicted nucleotidyltransferase